MSWFKSKSSSSKTKQPSKNEMEALVNQRTRAFIHFVNALTDIDEHEYTYLRQNKFTKQYETVRVSIFVDKIDNDEANELLKDATSLD